MLTDRVLWSDAEFDALYPTPLDRLARVHWTPVAVVRQLVEWLEPGPEDTVLDVGAGGGKFCILGSLLCGAHFVGIEQHARFVELARRTAAAVGASHAQFVQGDALELDWRQYTRLYLFNPFEEPSFGATERMGVGTRTAAKLAQLNAGTQVAVFHGFGDAWPEGYRSLFEATVGGGLLEVREKV